MTRLWRWFWEGDDWKPQALVVCGLIFGVGAVAAASASTLKDWFATAKEIDYLRAIVILLFLNLVKK